MGECNGIAIVACCGNKGNAECFKHIKSIIQAVYESIGSGVSCCGTKAHVDGINAEIYAVFKSCKQIRPICAALGKESLHNNDLCIGSNTLEIFAVVACCDACDMGTVITLGVVGIVVIVIVVPAEGKLSIIVKLIDIASGMHILAVLSIDAFKVFGSEPSAFGHYAESLMGSENSGIDNRYNAAFSAIAELPCFGCAGSNGAVAHAGG